MGAGERLRAPTITIRSKVGAGDSMVAGIVWAVAQDYSPLEAARFGVAAGAAAVKTPGTELCHRQDVIELYDQKGIMLRHHWYAIGGYGLLITLAVLGSLSLALTWLNMSRAQAVTVSFLTLAMAQLWHVFDMRDLETGVLRNEITTNPYIWAALAVCTVLLLLAVYLPILSNVLSTVDPGFDGWLLVLGMSVLPLIAGQTLKELGIGKI